MNAIANRNPLDYLKIIFRRKWLLIIPIFIGIIASIILSNVLPKAYRASTLILVEEGNIINPLVKGLTVSTSTAQRLTVLRQQILGWDRINQLINTLNLAKNVRNQEQFEKLVKQLRKSIIVNLHSNSLISIAYDGKDPAQAQNIVKTITDIFISENLRQQTQETENAISFINEQLALYQKKIKQSEISRMEDQLNALLLDSTEKHPMVVQLRKKIESANEELGKGIYDINASSLADSDSELKQLREELKEMKKEPAAVDVISADEGANRTKLSGATNEKLYKMLLLEKVDKVAARDAGVNKELYDTLLQRLETAKITRSLEASKEGTRYTILDPARLPLRPVKPNKIMVLLAGLFFGVCSGMALIFVVEALDGSFLGVDEARVFLGLPILGAITRIITQNDLKAQKLRRMKITSISIVAGVVLLAVIIFTVALG